jgi:transcriptional regulator with XRE-family HTH domain
MDQPEAAAPTSVGEFIRRSRETANLSQAGLAERLGTRQSTVSSWERDENGVAIETLYRLAEPLGWTGEDIDRAIGIMKRQAAESVATKGSTDPEARVA